MKSYEDNVIRVQDKGSRFVVLKTNNCVENVEKLIKRSSFDKLDPDPSSEFNPFAPNVQPFSNP